MTPQSARSLKITQCLYCSVEMIWPNHVVVAAARIPSHIYLVAVLFNDDGCHILHEWCPWIWCLQPRYKESAFLLITLIWFRSVSGVSPWSSSPLLTHGDITERCTIGCLGGQIWLILTLERKVGIVLCAMHKYWARLKTNVSIICNMKGVWLLQTTFPLMKYWTNSWLLSSKQAATSFLWQYWKVFI
jgi:hypothetical protein